MEERDNAVLVALLAASRKLAEAAANGLWDEVDALRIEQHDLIGSLFAGYERKTLTAEQMSGLAQVRVYTDMVLSLAKAKRTALHASVDTAKRGRVAVRAYGEATHAGA